MGVCADQFSQFSRSGMPDSLWLHGLKHVRLTCPSPTPGACSNSCPLSWWCHPTSSSSVTPFSSCLQSFLASGPFLRTQFFTSGGQVLELQLQHLSLQWIFRTDFLSVQETLKSLLQYHSSKASNLQRSKAYRRKVKCKVLTVCLATVCFIMDWSYKVFKKPCFGDQHCSYFPLFLDK